MTDIVERLRDQGRDAFAKQYSLGMWELCDEAATEIERLRSALETIAGSAKDKLQAMQARQALPNIGPRT